MKVIYCCDNRRYPVRYLQIVLNPRIKIIQISRTNGTHFYFQIIVVYHCTVSVVIISDCIL